MDGVLVDNMKFHEQAFYEFGKRRGVEITHDFFHTKLSGKTNEQIMPIIFGTQISTSEIKQMGEQKEAIYREIYAPIIKPCTGLIDFLDNLVHRNIGMAIASNAPKENIYFVVNELKLDKYFKIFLNGDDVVLPKPAPDMFLKAAYLLGCKPENSTVFEDSPGGIRAAKAANMKAIALLTTHKKEELIGADAYFDDFINILID